MIPLPYKHARAVSQLAAKKAKQRIPERLRTSIWDIIPAPTEGNAGLKIIRKPGGESGAVNRVIRTGRGQAAYLTNGPPRRQTLTRDEQGDRIELQDQELAGDRSWLRQSIEEAIEEYMQEHDPQQVIEGSPAGSRINALFDEAVEGIERMFS